MDPTATKGAFRSVLWLLALVVLVNFAALSLLRAYSSLNLWTDVASVPGLQTQKHSMILAALLALMAPAAASAMLLWPILRWLRRHRDGAGPSRPVARRRTLRRGLAITPGAARS